MLKDNTAIKQKYWGESDAISPKDCIDKITQKFNNHLSILKIKFSQAEPLNAQ